jgi:hypothetical protein
MQKANLSHFEHDSVKIHISIHQCEKKNQSPTSHIGTITLINQSVFCLSSAKNVSDTNAGLKTMTMTFHFCLTEAVPRQSKLPFSITALN